jgi:hypothetical protein
MVALSEYKTVTVTWSQIILLDFATSSIYRISQSGQYPTFTVEAIMVGSRHGKFFFLIYFFVLSAARYESGNTREQ